MDPLKIKRSKEIINYRAENEIIFNLDDFEKFCFEQVENYTYYLRAIAEIKKEKGGENA